MTKAIPKTTDAVRAALATLPAAAAAAREAAGKAENLETQDLDTGRVQTHEKTL